VFAFDISKVREVLDFTSITKLVHIAEQEEVDMASARG
jgi:chemotaxis signal transduction protein